ncbi:membrane transport protein [Salmonella bongori]|nr:membrane transport protein [Salmonella bongori]
MPGRAGAATTLFTNSISTGVILAGVIQGGCGAKLRPFCRLLGDCGDFCGHAGP